MLSLPLFEDFPLDSFRIKAETLGLNAIADGGIHNKIHRCGIPGPTGH